MKILSYIGNVIVSLIFGLMITSCIYEDNVENPLNREEGISLALHINAMGAKASVSSDAPVEMVKSLRVIIISENGLLEANDKITPDADDLTATGFRYSYMRMISPGRKKIYLIANEESVGRVMLAYTADLPAGLPLSSLSNLLGYFRSDPDNSSTGKNLEKVLNRVYYKNDYSSITEGNAIYLPYTTYYEINVEDGPLTQIEQPLHLVPVATKFDFTFINRRKEGAIIEDVMVCNVNSHNYLNAQLEEEEKWRTLGSETNVWWVDWLDACTRSSQNAAGTASDNYDFNKLWGWIKHYNMPVAGETLRAWSVKPVDEEWMIPGLVDKTNPSILRTGPFYLPESIQLKNTVPDNDEEDEDYEYNNSAGTQLYTLSFKVRDENEEQIHSLSGYELEQVKALFRATHVMVTIEFMENEVEIYAEVAPWEKRLFLGYVQEEY